MSRFFSKCGGKEKEREREIPAYFVLCVSLTLIQIMNRTNIEYDNGRLENKWLKLRCLGQGSIFLQTKNLISAEFNIFISS